MRPELLQMADRCPVMGHVIKYSSVASSGQVLAKGTDFNVDLFTILL